MRVVYHVAKPLYHSILLLEYLYTVIQTNFFSIPVNYHFGKVQAVKVTGYY
jgi:hypothetical protein